MKNQKKKMNKKKENFSTQKMNFQKIMKRKKIWKLMRKNKQNQRNNLVQKWVKY